MKIICFMKRKPGLTAEEFRDHYENHHAPLALELLPFFSAYKRNYIRHDLSYQPEHLARHAATPSHDVITELSFASRAEYEAMLAALADPVIGGRIARDEERFLDRDAMQMFFVDEMDSSAAAAGASGDQT